jgi:RHS repeat-associated protein
MPGTLPGSSAYTYAVDFTVDEAEALGATKVDFAVPVYSYMENFVGVPVGTQIPVGYYDKALGIWIPSSDGRVIKISSISSGKANLIVDTSGTPATDGKLDSLGFTDEERVTLASLYSVNQTLWRVPITHFTPYDYNYPYRLPDDAEPPRGKPPQRDESTGKCNTESGSIINCQNQALGETVSFPGLPSMNYRSDRVAARRWNRLTIDVTGATYPGSILDIRLEIKVAGRKFSYSYSPDANIKQEFEWDGLDAYGRRLSGKQPYSYTIFYKYPTEYAVPRTLPSNSSGASLDNGQQSFGLAGVGGFSSSVPARADYDLSDTYTGYLGVEEINDLGPGWSLENHHSYDPTVGILHMGSGEDKGVESGLGAIYTIAGGGTNDNPYGVPATTAEFGAISEMDVGPDGSIYLADRFAAVIWKVDRSGLITFLATAKSWHDVKVAPDGSLYLADADNNEIWKYSTSGVLTRVAGTGTAGFSGDGGLATDAKLNHATNIDVGPDGSLYIVDRSNFRIRKVSPSGIIQTIAGTGSTSFNGDSLQGPETNMGPGSLAVMDDGTIYFSDPSTGRIRKMDPSGMITTVAGNGTSGTDGDGGPALDAQTIADRIEVVSSKQGGTLIYLSDEINNTIRVVDEKENIYRFAGGGTDTKKNGIPGTSANLQEPRGTAVDAAGNFYVGIFGGSNPTARKILGRLPDFSNRDIFIPDMAAGQIYQFSPAGRHLKTFNAFTGKQLLEFGYNASGRLMSITDAYGNLTEIERDPGGDATALVNPYGRTLELDQDGSGNLSSITLPSGETHGFAYNAAGLLETYTTPRGFDHEFTYDSLGRLTRDDDPSGGYKTLAKTDTADGWKTTLTTAMGRTKVYDILPQVDRSTVQRNIDYAGLPTITEWGGDGVLTTTSPDTTISVTSMGPEPFLGYQAMQQSMTQIYTPGGIHSEIKNAQKVTLADTTNPLTLISFVDSTRINSALALTQYIDSTRMWITTSPEGRKDTVLVDSLGKVVERFVPGAESINYGYDAHGRLSSVSQGTGGDARVFTYHYNDDGYLSKIINPLGDSTLFEYDSAGRVTNKTMPGGHEISFAYDADGNIDSLIPPGRPAHEFGFTEVGLENHYAPPPLGVGAFDTHASYNLDKQLLEINRPDGKDIEYVYDGAGRLDSIHTSLGSYIFGYQPETGRLDSMASSYGIINRHTYDGSLPTSVSWEGAVSGSVSVEYNENFQVSAQSVNGSNPIFMYYDYDALLVNAGDAEYVWDDNGRLFGTFLGLVEAFWKYNAFGEAQKYSVLADEDTVYQYQLERDKLGRIKEKMETIGGVAHSFQYGYDPAGRLTSISIDSVLSASYSYDGNGNRLTRTTVLSVDSGFYDDQDRLTRYGSGSYSYNHQGDLEKKVEGADTILYHYDMFGNLASVKLPNGDSISYVMDGKNRRVGKKINGALVQGFLYQNQLSPLAVVDSDGVVLARFVYGVGRNAPDQMIIGDTTYQFICDHLGSPRLILNTVTGLVAQRMDYDEFGNVTYDSNPGFQPFGFAGGLYDSQIGLERFGARDYDPAVGRWTAKDPLGFKSGSTNVYGYVDADPINFIDPTGKSKGGKQKINTEGFGPHSDPKEIEKVLKEAIELKQAKRIKALRAILKVAKRGGTYALICGILIDITLDVLQDEIENEIEYENEVEKNEIDFTPV